MISQMSQREKTLAFLVGGTVLILLNVVLIKFFIGKYNESRSAKMKAEIEMQTFRALETDRERSAKRDTWLSAQLVPMGDSEVAGKELRESIQALAKKHEVLIENVSQNVANQGSNQPYISLGIRIEIKGKWNQMSYFLNELQGPEKFIVVEAMELKVDPSDKTQLRASMTVARWFSPKG